MDFSKSFIYITVFSRYLLWVYQSCLWWNLSKTLGCPASWQPISPNTSCVCLDKVNSFCFQLILCQQLTAGCCVRWTETFGECLLLSGVWGGQSWWCWRPGVEGGAKHYWQKLMLHMGVKQRRLCLQSRCLMPKCILLTLLKVTLVYPHQTLNKYCNVYKIFLKACSCLILQGFHARTTFNEYRLLHGI